MLLFIVAVMAGRVVPAFTNNAIAGAGARRHPWLEAFALGALLALIAADALERIEAAAVIAVVAAALHAARLALWSPGKVLRRNGDGSVG